MSANEILSQTIPGRLKDPAEREKMMELDAVFQFHLTGDEAGSWYIDLKAGECASGEHDQADCTVTLRRCSICRVVRHRSEFSTTQASQRHTKSRLSADCRMNAGAHNNSVST